MAEGSDVTLTCVTDESIPDAMIQWSIDGESVTSTSDSVESGDYSANKTRSTLTLTVDRSMNDKEVQCSVLGETEVTDQATLEVQCKYKKYNAFPLEIVNLNFMSASV